MDKLVEGLGILLMIVGMTLIEYPWIDNWHNYVGIAISCGGWILYSFAEKLEEIR